METWIFGYASLIWKTGFEYDRKTVGFIKGQRRAFHLACFEHRGTFDHPARVATLEKDDEAICWGVAFCIKGAEAAENALSYLKDRESEYDTIETVEVFTEESPNVPVIANCLVFTSSTTSKYYLGLASNENIALQIATATGPCGPNRDYLFRLVEALRDIGHEDPEVIDLANAVRRKLSEHNSSVNIKVSTTTNQNGVYAYPQPHLLIPSTPMPLSPRLLKSHAR